MTNLCFKKATRYHLILSAEHGNESEGSLREVHSHAEGSPFVATSTDSPHVRGGEPGVG